MRHEAHQARSEIPLRPRRPHQTRPPRRTLGTQTEATPTEMNDMKRQTALKMTATIGATGILSIGLLSCATYQDQNAPVEHRTDITVIQVGDRSPSIRTFCDHGNRVYQSLNNGGIAVVADPSCGK